jgi:biotin carboxyl carrier protein
VSTDRSLRVDVRGPTELTVQLHPQPGIGEEVGDVLVERLPTPAASSVERFEVVIEGWRFEVSVEPARHAELRELAARAAGDHRPSAGASLRAQIPGRVTRIWVAPGDLVEQGQRLLAVEAMKMENEVRAPHAGVVDTVGVAVGSLVERNDALLTLK